MLGADEQADGQPPVGVAETAAAPSQAAQTPEWAGRALLGCLVLWGAGAQLTEALAVPGALGAAIILCVLAFGEGGVDLRRFAIAWAPLLAFVAWGLSATALAGDVAFTGALARHLDWLLLPVAGAALWRLDPRRRRLLVAWCLGAFVLSAIVAGLQHYGVWPTLEQFGSWRWTRAAFHRVYEQVPGTEGRFMAGGLLFHRLKFAHVSGLVVLWALVLGLRADGRVRWLCLGLGGLGAVAVLVFPYARATFAALLAGAAVAALLERRRRRLALALAAGMGVVVLAVFALHAPLRERMLSAATAQGSGDRQHLWQAGLEALKENPLTGTGVGKFQAKDYASPHAPVHVREHQGKAHNQLLSTAAEMGVVGLLLFAFFLQWMVRRMRPGTVEGAAGIAAFAFWAVLSLTHDPMFHAEVSLAFVFCFGLAAAGQNRPSQGVPRG